MANGKKPDELIPIEGVMLNSENYGEVAEKVMNAYMHEEKASNNKKKQLERVTTSKLRGIYGLIMNLYTQINDKSDFDNHKDKGDLQYLRVRMTYESGRKPAVKEFLEITRLMDSIGAVKTYEQFMLYCRYAESLVAYFKFYGGRD